MQVFLILTHDYVLHSDQTTIFLSVLELNVVRKVTDAQNPKGSKDAHEAGNQDELWHLEFYGLNFIK